MTNNTGYRSSTQMARLLNRLLLSATALSVAVATALDAQASEQDELLRSVLAQNAAAYKNIKSLYVDYSAKTEAVVPQFGEPGGPYAPGGLRVTTIRNRIWQQGDHYLQDLEMRHTWPDSGKVVNASQIVLLGEKYFVRLHKRINTCDVYWFENRQNLYPPIDTMITTFPSPHILPTCFIAWGGILREEAYLKSTSRRTWTIAPEADAPLQYRIKQTDTKKEKPWLVSDFIIDGSRGFLIPEYRLFKRSGELMKELKLTMQKVSNDQWFPVEITEHTPEDSGTSSFTVHEAKINEPIPVERFTFEALEFNPQLTTLIEHSPGGRTETKKGYLDGEWVPFSMLPRAQINALNAANRAGMGN